MSADNKVAQLLADSKLAFLNQQNEQALKLATEARKIEPNNPETHKCVANAYMSMGQLEEAVKCYTIAAKYDPANGNRYFDLGYACAAMERLGDALKHLAKAEELGCIPENLIQLYNLLGIICVQVGKLDDALINLEKAQKLVGVDLDLLQRKVVIYGMKNDIRKGLEVANQIKLISPSDYRGYQFAFKLLLQGEYLDIAEKELEKAAKYVEPNMNYYVDCISLEVAKYKKDGDKKHYENSLALVAESLEKTKPTVKEVTEAYINASEIYVQMEKADDALNCLNAALNPIGSFNLGFEVLVEQYEPRELTDYDLEDMIAEDRERIAEKFGDYGFEEFVESHEVDEDGTHDFLTELPEEEKNEEKYVLEADAEFSPSVELTEQINRLFTAAYTIKKDYDKVIAYAKKMQTSENIFNVHAGKYAEVNAHLLKGDADANARYEDLIKYYRNAMIKDPTDIMAATMRIQCFIDLGRYDEAENASMVLAEEARKPILDRIAKARQGGE